MKQLHLQITCYNFSATGTNNEVCVGVVKARKVHEKNPAQHAADLADLETKAELQHVFNNPFTGSPNSIDCIRVDGTSDEGPGHEEVQYFWTKRHIEKRR